MFFHTYHSLPVSPMYTFPQEQDILCTPAELSGGLWSLGFLKICPIFLGDLKTVWMLLFNILPMQSVVLFIYRRMEKIFLPISCDGCVLWFIAFLMYLLIILFVSFLSCPFFWKACFRWLSPVCKCSLSEMVKVLCTTELIADCFCAGWWCDSACKYLSVCVGFLYTWWPRVLSAFLVTRTSRKRSFLSFSMSMIKQILGCWLRKIRNLWSSALPQFLSLI